MNILILSYYFPPDGDIGGRRWAKFAKNLTLNGNKVTVLTKKPLNINSDKWKADTSSYSARIKYFEDNYPQVLNKSNLSFTDKIKYKIALNKVSKYLGNFYDPTCTFDSKLTLHVEAIIQDESIDAVIVSGYPFHWQEIISGIITKFPEVAFVADFRDLWLNNKIGYGYSSLTTDRYQYEALSQKNVIEKFDLIFSVSEQMNDYFETQIDDVDPGKFHEVTNGFDADDIIKTDLVDELNDNVVRFVFAGNLYNGLDYILPEFVSAIEKISQLKKGQFEFRFYGSAPSYFIESIKEIDEIKFFGTVSLDHVHKEIRNGDYAMLFLTKDVLFSKSTKFYEYVSHEKPIVVFSDPGETGAYVEDEGIGFHCETGTVFETLSAKLDNRDIETYYSNFNSSQFDIANITRQIESILDLKITEKRN
ncbi:MAG: glycosyltransferase involved in cell wall biosynthesis [Parvicellaceae bacterium]|jgi:glycosyltransferase involved in cell wall biosynthesis